MRHASRSHKRRRATGLRKFVKKRLDRGNSTGPRKARKEVAQLKESPLFSKIKKIYGILARSSGQLFSRPSLCLTQSLLSLFTVINLATIG